MQRDKVHIEPYSDHEDVICGCCKERRTWHKVAMLLRLRPGDDFDPICSGCTYQIVNSAMRDMDTDTIAIFAVN